MLYNVEKGRWYHKEGVSLSFEEKEILLLSSQGYTVKEIAAVLSKSEDTIKMYKRVMFSKLKVKSIAEAIIAAINGNLILCRFHQGRIVSIDAKQGEKVIKGQIVGFIE